MAGRRLRVGVLAVFAVTLARGDESGTWQPPEPIFTEVAAEVGLDFEHRAGRSAEYYFPETVGSGVALFDYDNDGDLDVYLVQSGRIAPGGSAADAAVSDRLFRNDLTVDENGGMQLRFVDVTDEARIEARGYGMGVAAADYDNDGHVDLYVTNFGPNQLLHNNGDGTFTGVSAVPRTGDPGWSTSASFVDYDRDGWLDLYVGNYVRYSVERNKECFGFAGNRDYCGPESFEPQPDRLLHNRGDGRFEDVSGGAGIHAAFGAALGVVSADFDADGWPDIYVANDQTENQLWINQRDGTFQDSALLAGVSVNGDGVAEASMGVDAGDIDNDRDEEIVLSHLNTETNTLYVNQGAGLFADVSRSSGIGIPSLPYTGFGAGWVDFDNDGLLDLLVVNGAVKAQLDLLTNGNSDPYRQANQLFQNLNGHRFREVSEWGGAGITTALTSRGAAFGDLDNDGDPDVVIQNNDGSAQVVLNRVGSNNHWVGLRLIDGDLQRDAIGARVMVITASGRSLHRRVRADGSWASANDPRVLVGLGRESELKEIQVLWPDGDEESFGALEIDHYHTLVKDSGQRLKTKTEPGQP